MLAAITISQRWYEKNDVLHAPVFRCPGRLTVKEIKQDRKYAPYVPLGIFHILTLMRSRDCIKSFI
jgi:hypothetical protein